MTTDDLVSMHKACERVIEDMSIIKDPETTPNNRQRATVLAANIEALAVVQRDLIRGLLAPAGRL